MVELRAHHRPQLTLPKTTMSQSPFTFQPIPDACPIPRGIVAWIGGVIEEEHPNFALWRDKEQIVIEAKGEMNCAKGLDPNDPHFDWKLGCAVTKRYSDILQVIVSTTDMTYRSILLT